MNVGNNCLNDGIDLIYLQLICLTKQYFISKPSIVFVWNFIAFADFGLYFISITITNVVCYRASEIRFVLLRHSAAFLFGAERNWLTALMKAYSCMYVCNTHTFSFTWVKKEIESSAYSWVRVTYGKKICYRQWVYHNDFPCSGHIDWAI